MLRDQWRELLESAEIVRGSIGRPRQHDCPLLYCFASRHAATGSGFGYRRIGSHRREIGERFGRRRPLEVIGTDAVLDLYSGDADLAIR